METERESEAERKRQRQREEVMAEPSKALVHVLSSARGREFQSRSP